MKLEMTDTDARRVDDLFDRVLDAYKDDVVTKSQAREALAHVLYAAAVRDEPHEVRAWLNPDRVTKWLEDCRAKRT